MSKANRLVNRIVEDEIESAIESRNEALSALRELGPPDLVHLIKQSVKSGGRQVLILSQGIKVHSVDFYDRLAFITM